MEVVKLLLCAKVDVEKVNNEGKQALDLASDPEILHLLKETINPSNLNYNSDDESDD